MIHFIHLAKRVILIILNGYATLIVVNLFEINRDCYVKF